jgi:hypothetical protein
METITLFPTILITISVLTKFSGLRVKIIHIHGWRTGSSKQSRQSSNADCKITVPLPDSHVGLPAMGAETAAVANDFLHVLQKTYPA